MKRIFAICIVLIGLGEVFALPPRSFAQQAQEQTNGSMRYRFVDLGTLGGPNSYQPFEYASDFQTVASLSVRGTFAGWADTSAADPYAPNCFFDCFVDHAFQWKDGVPTDLGALPGPPGLSAAVTWISPNGLISGFSENGEIDPLLDLAAFHGVLWYNGKIIDLKPLPSGYESWANAVNDQGQVVGYASNAIDNPNSLQGLVTQTRAVLWQNGAVRDLGTLGGTDAEALFINDQGQIVGLSYTVNSITPPSNDHCQETPLTVHAFFFEKGRMVDLDTLGGSCTFANALNDYGQVAGESTIDGNQDDHPFIWEQEKKMKDLGTLGGTHGYAAWLNDSGMVVGAATNKGNQALLAFQWKDDVMTNLGTLAGDACSVSDAINSGGQVVGGSGLSIPNWPACTDLVEHAFLWENGRMIDLNSFVPDSSDLTLSEAVFINDRGEISGFGTLPNGDQHDFLLVPCQASEDGCEEAQARSAKVTQAPAASPAKLSRAEMPTRFRSLQSGHNRRYGIPQTSPQ
jgi:probable HAF family extracellular repeat protein